MSMNDENLIDEGYTITVVVRKGLFFDNLRNIKTPSSYLNPIWRPTSLSKLPQNGFFSLHLQTFHHLLADLCII